MKTRNRHLLVHETALVLFTVNTVIKCECIVQHWKACHRVSNPNVAFHITHVLAKNFSYSFMFQKKYRQLRLLKFNHIATSFYLSSLKLEMYHPQWLYIQWTCNRNGKNNIKKKKELLNIFNKASMWLHAMTEEIRGYQIGTLQRPAQGQSYYATE